MFWDRPLALGDFRSVHLERRRGATAVGQNSVTRAKVSALRSDMGRETCVHII